MVVGAFAPPPPPRAPQKPAKPPSPPAVPAPPGCEGRQVVWSSNGDLLLGPEGVCKSRWWLCDDGCGTAYKGHDGDPTRYQWHSTGCSCPVPSFAEVVAMVDQPPSLPPPPSPPPVPSPPPLPPTPWSGMLQLWGETELPEAPVDIAVSLGYAFVVASSELTVVNVTDPMQPMVVGHAAPLSNAVRVAAKKDVAFVAENPADSDGSKLLVYHTIDKTMPTFFAMLTMPPDVQDIAYPGGDFLFAVVGGLPAENRMLLVVDVGDPEDPRIVGNFTDPSLYGARFVESSADGNTVLVLSNTTEFLVSVDTRPRRVRRSIWGRLRVGCFPTLTLPPPRTMRPGPRRSRRRSSSPQTMTTRHQGRSRRARCGRR